MNQYRTIGAELICYEQQYYQQWRGYSRPSFEALRAFREGVVFVPVEILESYLEDLLELDISEERLFIYRERSSLPVLAIALLGLFGSLAAGLFAAYVGASLILSFALTAIIALPFGVLLHFAPRDSLTRRMMFAKVVSHEISRRRGGDRESGEVSSLTLEQLLRAGNTGSFQGAARNLTN